MSKRKLQCEHCHRAEFDEELYEYDGEILCRPCVVAQVTESIIPCEYIGNCNDKTYPNKDQQLAELKVKYDNLYKCYQKTSQEDLKDKYDLAEESEQLKAEIEQDKQYIKQLEQDYKKVNELGLEPSYIKQVIKENEQLKAENEKLRVQIPTFDYKAYENDLEEIVKHLQHQLKEKDDEIKRLKTIVDTVDKLKQIFDKTTNFIILDVDTYTREYAEKMQVIAKQVCEKMGNWGKEHCYFVTVRTNTKNRGRRR